MTKDDDQPRVALAKAIRNLKENLPAHLELVAMQARLTRARYLALIDQGFSVDEALRLCTQTPSF